MTEIQNSKHVLGILIPTQGTNSPSLSAVMLGSAGGNQVSFGHWILRFICDLVLVIWDFKLSVNGYHYSTPVCPNPP